MWGATASSRASSPRPHFGIYRHARPRAGHFVSRVTFRCRSVARRRTAPPRDLPVAAVTMEAVVGPAMTSADRRTPERLAPDRPDHAADHGAGRTGNQQTRTGAGRGTHHVGARTRRR